MSLMADQNTWIQAKAPSVEMNRVLKNTYFLLSLTLLFSGLMAFWAMSIQASMPNIFLVLIVEIGLIFAVQALRNKAIALLPLFGFTGFTGYVLGPLLNMYISTFSNGSELVTTALVATGGIFFALSAYVAVTRKNFSFMGGFLFVAFLGAFLVSLAGMVFHMPMMSMVMSGVFVLLFSGYILYDTSRIVSGGETNYILAALALYIDIYGLFINLLQLLSYFAGNNRD